MAATKTPTKDSSANVWSDEERAAMQQRARERKTSARVSPREEHAAGERDFHASIAKMPEPDRAMAERIDAVVVAAVPDLARKTYYGMPAYAKDGNVICWVKNAGKFKMRYDTLEFSDKAHLDDGSMWPASYAVKELSPAVEARLVALVKKAAG